jgi:serine/threonine protein kinase
VMDLLTGGDLRYHIARHRKFTEEQTKFFIGCIIVSLEYIHGKSILHRDIKPENLVFDDKGYLRVTDFGIARIWNPENSKETSGTPGYMAPEVMCRQNHGVAVDYFAVGIIGYECMMGRVRFLFTRICSGLT